MTDTKKSSRDLMCCALVSALAIILPLIEMFFHEPWYDEAQAFLIARDASLHDIFFVIPHYEGHPPLWHLLLLIPARLGLSCKLTLGIAQMITYAMAVLVLEFRSPFHKITKMLLPCSFFFLYQFAVISRPYAMMMLAMFLCADTYNEREKKPLPYILSMIFLCLCHSYGIAFAGGLAAADILRRIFHESSILGGIRTINKKLLIGYGILLLSALIITAEIMPAKDSFAVNEEHKIGYPKMLLLCIILMPSETFVTSFSKNQLVAKCTFSSMDIVLAAIIAIVFFYFIINICRKRKILLEFIIPYFFLVIIMAAYVHTHHLGIFLNIVIFILWVAAKKEPITMQEICEPLTKIKLSPKFAETLIKLTVVLVTSVNLYWNAYSYVTDIKQPYEVADDAANWINDNLGDDAYIISTWVDDNSNHFNSDAIPINCFYKKNIFKNAYKNISYSTHMKSSYDEYNAMIKKIKEHGEPDAIITPNAIITDLFEELEIKNNYEMCYFKYCNRVFKAKEKKHLCIIYVRKDLADKVEKKLA